MDYLIDPVFQWVNRLIVLSFKDNAIRTRQKEYFLPKVEKKDYNFMADRKNEFDQPIRKNIKTYENITKTATGQGHDYTTGFLLD